MRTQKRSQAALEFLTTYAWAFIVIGIIIAAIAYFGILKPQKILPDRCTFNVGFGCEAYGLVNGPAANDDVVRIRLKNGVGNAATVTAVAVTTEAGTAIPLCTLTTPAALPASVGVASVQDFEWTGCNFEASGIGFLDGEKVKAFFRVDYYDPKVGATYAKIAEGEIFTTVS